MKDFPNESKNKKWTRIFKKRWFFPALYIVLAAFLLTGVVWYQNTQSKMFGNMEEFDETDFQNDSIQSDRYDQEAKEVAKQEETVQMPVEEEAQSEIVTTFYDYTADEDDQEKGLTFYNNRYYQSTGIDIAADDDDSLKVIAALSGTVEEVKEDPLHGHVVVIDHGDDISTHYASLQNVKVKKGDKLKQGDEIGQAGNNLFNEDGGTHVHFEISKDNIALNPEDFFNQSLTVLKEVDVESEANLDNSDPSTEDTNADEPDSDTKKDQDTEEDNETSSNS